MSVSGARGALALGIAEAGAVALSLSVLWWQLGLRGFEALARPVRGGDVPEYVDGAKHMRVFFDSGGREPLHVFFVKLSQMLTGSANGTGEATVALTFVAAIVLYFVARRLVGVLGAQLATLAFCASPVVGFYAFSGLRAPLWSTVLLAFTGALFVPIDRDRALRVGATVAATAALVVWTRVYGFPIIAAAFGYWLLAQRAWRLERRWLVLFALAVIAAAVLAYLPHIALRADQPRLARDADFWRTLEQSGAGGLTEGGPQVSSFHWVFVEHSVLEIVRRFVANTWLYASDYMLRFLRPAAFLWPLVVFGAVFALRTGRAFLLVVLWLAIAPWLFILHLQQVPGVVGVENRFVYQAYPFVLMLLAHGASELLRAGVVRWSRFATLLPLLGPVRYEWGVVDDEPVPTD